jgi:hypothetical protein
MFRSRLATLLVLMLVGSPVASAKKRKKRSARPEDVRIKSRTLNGHRFLSSDYLADPFITSYANASTAFGMSDIDLEVGGCDPNNPDCDGELPTPKFAAVRQLFEVQISILDRVGIAGGIAGDFLVGRDAATAFATAAEGGVAGGGSAKVKVYDNKWTQFSASGGAAVGSYQTASPANVFTNTILYIAEGLPELKVPGENDLADWLFSKSKVVRYQGAAHGAYSPHKTVGLLGSVSYLSIQMGTDEVDVPNTAHSYLVTDLGVSASLTRVVPVVPLGTFFGVQRQFRLEDSDGAQQSFAAVFGLYYAGRDYLDLGLEYAYEISRSTLTQESEYVLLGDQPTAYIDTVRYGVEQRLHIFQTRLRVYL